MGGDQAAKTLMQIKLSKMSDVSEEEKQKIYNKIKFNYNKQIIEPSETRNIIIRSLEIINNQPSLPEPKFSVFQC